jgi:hypothetical protein
MLTLRRLALVAAAALIMVTGVMIPASADPPTGFILVGSNAAYSDHSTGFVSGGTDYVLEIQVGYVEAKMLKFFGGETYRPHTDVDVRLCVFRDAPDDWCGSEESLQLSGVKNLPWDGDAKIVKLESALLDQFRLSVTGDGVAADLLLALEWEAYGRTVTEPLRGPGQHGAQKTRQAHLTGSIEIEGLTGGGPLSALVGAPLMVQDLTPFPDSPPRIVFYNEISHEG